MKQPGFNGKYITLDIQNPPGFSGEDPVMEPLKSRSS